IQPSTITHTRRNRPMSSSSYLALTRMPPLRIFFTYPPPTAIYTLSLHDALPISPGPEYPHQIINTSAAPLKYLSISTMDVLMIRSEEHTSELQSRGHLVCRLLLEKKKPKHRYTLSCAGARIRSLSFGCTRLAILY